MDDNSEMPFGKYAGEKMANVPDSYLIWCWNNHIVSMRKFPRVYMYIRDNLDVIESEFKKAGSK